MPTWYHNILIYISSFPFFAWRPLKPPNPPLSILKKKNKNKRGWFFIFLFLALEGDSNPVGN